MSLGKQLKSHREQLGLTQQEVADQLHVSRQTISNWEVGRNYPDIPTIIQISDYYELSLDVLLKGDEYLMKKMNEDAAALQRLKTKKRLDTVLIGIILLLVFLGILDQLHFSAAWIPVILIGVLYVLTTARYFIVIPKDSLNSGWHSPLVVPKSLGVGWALNPRNPIGLFLYAVIFAAIMWAVISSWSDRSFLPGQ
ncbi:helix-turn-helix transcriptional regulator [Enterococcus sp. CWB-B31]|uniref:helix-turn-helix transcriptional regulator n=1 Tax=Enterococcus sp. CWB-B31 TaxID=2885159 RepID=UPI001E51AEF0|nr:helix-turn-helix domain-containing protein [Enterococcus sp. CWB-B31]MCB5955402.1 helix-turn-helix domain-containing protein [Enterococcus sp. CWB-B31]